MTPMPDTVHSHTIPAQLKPDYDVDAPAVMRNMFLFGGLCILLALVLPPKLHFGHVVVSSRIPFTG